MNLAFRFNTTAAPSPGAHVDQNGERVRAASLAINPRISQWLRFHPDGYVEVRPGKVEIGQGIVTALAQIVAEELDLSLARVRMVAASTRMSPDEAVTSGSLSVQESGAALRQVSAHARALFLDAAAQRMGVTRAGLRIEDGVIRGSDASSNGASGGALTYWTLTNAVNLDIDASSEFSPKPCADHHIVGTPAPRRDLPEKIFGQPRLIHDLVLPGMLHGRVVRSSARAAQLLKVDFDAIRALPGVVAVVRDGNFLGVIAEGEAAATFAAEQLAVNAQWSDVATLPDANDLVAWLRTQPVETKVVDQRGAAASAANRSTGTQAQSEPNPRTLRATYSRAFIAHASIAPSCALAHWQPAQPEPPGQSEQLEVWSHSQGIFNLRTDLALAFARTPESIVVHHVEGAGCYGHNGADDAAYDAALLARAVPGRPVRLQWTRAQELGWGPFSPAMCVDLEATLDGNGAITGWTHDVISNGHGTRPGRANTPALLAATHLEQPFEPLIAVNAPLGAGGGAERNAVPLYDFPAWTITNHRLLTMPLRTSALRSLGAHCNVFALESFIDEIAHSLGEDAVAFRLRHLNDTRAIEVIERAAKLGQWRGANSIANSAADRTAANPSPACENHGQGIAFAKYKNTGAYCAVVAEVEVAREVRVLKLSIAVDVGLVINPDGVKNQVEGGAIQAASMTLKEAVAFDASRVTSDAWERYPILKFSEVPQVEVDLIARPDLPAVGAGEAAHGPVAAAIANAVFNAIGVRVRAMPITPERIVAAMQ